MRLLRRAACGGLTLVKLPRADRAQGDRMPAKGTRMSTACVRQLLKVATLALLGLGPAVVASPAAAEPMLERFLETMPPGDLVEGADAYGAIRDDVPVAPVLKDGARIGWAWVNSDFVG